MVKAKTRNPPDPNRTPLYLDNRLPPGWHRKVSQRKSGASAGRFEVFIIGPTGKRFRSRNELKAFFEKTGENVLKPEHFDFSTFGTNAVTLPKEYADKIAKKESPAPETPKTPVSTNPVFKSQLSRETAEADAQISQLLESLQKDSKLANLQPVDSEKMSELFNSLAGSCDDSSCSSPPPTTSGSSLTKAMTTSPSKLPQLTSGMTGFQASFLNSISDVKSTKPDSNVSTSTSGLNNVATMAMGGAATQRRALQNLPQNTKLVKGPNGQYSLQKVQTIELTVEQQTVSLNSKSFHRHRIEGPIFQNLRAVQSRIQEIEKLPTKSAKDENELAQLHVKQQQILASGRPVPAQNIQEVRSMFRTIRA